MAIKRLSPGFGIGQDSCVSGRHPMTEQDVLNGTEGVFLGNNPEAPATGLFLTFWEADEVAQCIGFPHITVYEEQKRLIYEQAVQIADLERQLDEEIHSLQLKAVSTEIKNTKKELLNALEGTTSAIRARLGSSRSDTDAPKGAVDVGAGATAL